MVDKIKAIDKSKWLCYNNRENEKSKMKKENEKQKEKSFFEIVNDLIRKEYE